MRKLIVFPLVRQLLPKPSFADNISYTSNQVFPVDWTSEGVSSLDKLHLTFNNQLKNSYIIFDNMVTRL